MDVFRSLWKAPTIHDPFLSLTNLDVPKPKACKDRFCNSPTKNLLIQPPMNRHDQQNTHQSNKKQQQSNYLNLLGKTCKLNNKKQNCKSYSSKIKRNGYLLDQEVSQIIQEKSACENRALNEKPYRILNAPKLKDDFYTNLLDWSSNDTVGVVLDNAAYTWNSKQSETQKIIEGYISCLKFGKGLILGQQTGRIRAIDVQKKKETAKYRNHYSRVGTIDCFSGNLIASGSKDNTVLLWDLRSNSYVRKFENHRQEVCGVKWSFDGNYIASGGNDNTIYVWDQRSGKAIQKYTEHTAAIKALAWSPHKNNILATGGGSTDKSIRIWNINEKLCIKKVDTGSQVCNMMYSKNSNQLVSTHGFSLNSINIWDGKNMENIGTLRGHSFRVLYLAPSPDGESIVTGSGDQTLRFWKVFPGLSDEYGGCSLQTKNISIR